MKQKLDAPAGYIVCGSHRARSHAFGVIGRDRQGYHLAFTDYDIRHKGIYPVTADELARCVAKKGVRKLGAKREPYLRECW